MRLSQFDSMWPGKFKIECLLIRLKKLIIFINKIVMNFYLKNCKNPAYIFFNALGVERILRKKKCQRRSCSFGSEPIMS